jgi:DNA-binding NtrC family response regulator
VRELKNIIERAALMAASEPIGPEHILLDAEASSEPHDSEPDALTMVTSRHELLSPSSKRQREPVSSSPPTDVSREQKAPEDEQRTALILALDACAGNQTRAAKMLGITRRQLIARIEFWNLPRPKKR